MGGDIESDRVLFMFLFVTELMFQCFNMPYKSSINGWIDVERIFIIIIVAVLFVLFFIFFLFQSSSCFGPENSSCDMKPFLSRSSC